MRYWEQDKTTVVVTGIGIMTAIASDREHTWQKLLQGNSGIKLDPLLQIPVARIDDDRIDHARIVKEDNLPSRAQYFLEKVVLEAIADAKLELPLNNCGVVIGSSRSNQRELELLLNHPCQNLNPNYPLFLK